MGGDVANPGAGRSQAIGPLQGVAGRYGKRLGGGRVGQVRFAGSHPFRKERGKGGRGAFRWEPPLARIRMVVWVTAGAARRPPMMKFLLWCILFVLCWPLALVALVLYPLVWLLLLPFRLVGIAVGGVLDLVSAIILLPARVIRAI